MASLFARPCSFRSVTTNRGMSWRASILRGNQTCKQLTCSTFVTFSAFLPLVLSISGILVANKRATNFLGSSFLGNCMLPTVALLNEVRSAVRAHLTKKAVFPAYYTSKTHILKSFFFKAKHRLCENCYRCIDASMKTRKNILRSFTEHNQ